MTSWKNWEFSHVDVGSLKKQDKRECLRMCFSKHFLKNCMSLSPAPRKEESSALFFTDNASISSFRIKPFSTKSRTASLNSTSVICSLSLSSLKKRYACSAL